MSFPLALEHAAILVRGLRPWEGLSIDGVAVGFDDGDLIVLFAR